MAVISRPRRRRRPWWRHLTPEARALLAWLLLLAIAVLCFSRGWFMGVGSACLLACLVAPPEGPS